MEVKEMSEVEKWMDVLLNVTVGTDFIFSTSFLQVLTRCDRSQGYRVLGFCPENIYSDRVSKVENQFNCVVG